MIVVWGRFRLGFLGFLTEICDLILGFLTEISGFGISWRESGWVG